MQGAAMIAVGLLFLVILRRLRQRGNKVKQPVWSIRSLAGVCHLVGFAISVYGRRHDDVPAFPTHIQ